MSRSRSRRRDPAEYTVREAVKRYLRRRRSDSTDASVDSWWYRLKLFVEWTEGVGIELVDDLRGYDFDEYYEIRSANVAAATLEGEMYTLKKFAEYLDQIGVGEDDLSESVRIPDLDTEDRTNDTLLKPDKALALIAYYRGSEENRACRQHAFTELAWFTGARQGALRGLDVRDVKIDSSYVEFHHRPETDTPLKNKIFGERPVAIPPESAAVLKEYREGDRCQSRCDHGRQPFLSTARGRPTSNTIRIWSYLATLPCSRGRCPHDKNPDLCEWTEYAHASKCPSSRSPHKLRSGSITWQLNIGIPPEVVSARVDAEVRTILNHYDWATQEERWRRERSRMEDRRSHVENMSLD